MWRVTRKGLAANRLRYVLTAVAVLIGVAFLSGTMMLTDTIQRAFDDLFADINRGTDAVVRAKETLRTDFGGSQRPRVSQGLLEQVRGVRDVAAVEGNVQIGYAQLVGRNGKPVGNPDAGPPALGFGWNPNGRLNQWRLQPGSRPPAASDEIVIDKGSADKGHLRVGDIATLLTSKPPARYRIVGIAKFGTADSPLGASVVLLTIPQAQQIADAYGQYDQISVVADRGVSQDQVTASIRRALGNPRDVEAITGREFTKQNQDDVHRAIGFISKAVLVFALVALLVATFLIYNTFSIIVAQRTRELALLRAIGASGRQVMASVLGESFVVGLLASAVGLVMGLLVSAGLKGLMAALGFDLPSTGVVLRPQTVIVGMLVGVVVTTLSAAMPARRAASIPPVAAMREVAFERAPKTAARVLVGGGIIALGVAALLLGLFGHVRNGIVLVGVGALAVFVGVFVLAPLFARRVSTLLGAPLARVKGITGTLARENAARNPKRTAATAAALMIGVALVGFITIFAASAKKSISAAIDKQMTSDYIVTSGQGTGNSGLSPELGRAIARLPVVKAATPLRFAPIQVEGSRAFVVAADPVAGVQLFDFDVREGNLRSLTADGLAISRRIADDKHLHLGSAVAVTFADTGTTTLRVEAIYRRRELAKNYLVSLTAYEQHVRTSLDFFVVAKLKPGVTPDEGRKAIEPLLRPYPTAKLKDQAQFKADQEAQVNRVVALVYALLALAVIVALIGIANTLALSIHERTRELGLLRAVGMSRSQVRSAVRWESVIISLLGTVLGLAIGLFFGWVIVAALRDEGFSQFAAAPGQLLVVVVIAAIAGVGAAILPARRASKLDVLRAIATE